MYVEQVNWSNLYCETDQYSTPSKCLEDYAYPQGLLFCHGTRPRSHYWSNKDEMAHRQTWLCLLGRYSLIKGSHISYCVPLILVNTRTSLNVPRPNLLVLVEINSECHRKNKRILKNVIPRKLMKDLYLISQLLQLPCCLLHFLATVTITLRLKVI